MGFGAGCCKLCAWWSVIGAFTYFTIAMMIARRNWSVIQEKIGIQIELDGGPKEEKMNEELTATQHKMLLMVVVMILSSVCCFSLGFFLARREKESEEAEAVARERDYGLIFGDDGVAPKESGESF